jgi:alpha-galactosidase/6-phospho-beta-glucosidase family protein
MTAVRIALVGGGSYAWGPLFIRDMVCTPELSGSTLVLHDIDPEALDLLYTLGCKMVRQGDRPFLLERTLDPDEALQGADFVILTVTTGGLEAMRHDLEIPEKFGVYQSVGDTVGPGGLARALRSVPVVLDLARRMERLCPDAWLLNYTNPMATLCRGVTRETCIRVIGLCHEYVGVRHRLAQIWEVAEDDIQAELAGINHLAWVLDLKVHGREAMPQLHELAGRIMETGGAVLGTQEEGRSSSIDRALIKARLLRIYGALPAAGDRHVAEFFPWFLTEAAGRGRKYGIRRTSVDERYEWHREDERLIRSLLADEEILGQWLQHQSGEAANQIVAALCGHGRYMGPLNLPNEGQITNLPPGVIVETLGVVEAAGVRGFPVGDLPPGVQAVVARHVFNQEMIVEAALKGDRKLALQATLNDPLLQEVDRAERMLDEMLEAHKAYLPSFF